MSEYEKQVADAIEAAEKYTSVPKGWLSMVAPSRKFPEPVSNTTFPDGMVFSHYDDDQPVFVSSSTLAESDQ